MNKIKTKKDANFCDKINRIFSFESLDKIKIVNLYLYF